MIKKSIENLPLIEDNKKVLIVGANGDIGFETLKLFSRSNLTIGAHYHKNASRIKKFVLDNKCISEIKLFQSDLTIKNSNQKLIDEFVEFAGGIDIISIGVSRDSSPSMWYDGAIAEVGVWDVVLTAAEIEDLYDGTSTPAEIQADNLISYHTFDNTLADAAGDLTWTAYSLSSPTYVDGPFAVEGGVTIPIIIHHLKMAGSL